MSTWSRGVLAVTFYIIYLLSGCLGTKNMKILTSNASSIEESSYESPAAEGDEKGESPEFDEEETEEETQIV